MTQMHRHFICTARPTINVHIFPATVHCGCCEIVMVLCILQVYITGKFFTLFPAFSRSSQTSARMCISIVYRAVYLHECAHRLFCRNLKIKTQHHQMGASCAYIYHHSVRVNGRKRRKARQDIFLVLVSYLAFKTSLHVVYKIMRQSLSSSFEAFSDFTVSMRSKRLDILKQTNRNKLEISFLVRICRSFSTCLKFEIWCRIVSNLLF